MKTDGISAWINLVEYYEYTQRYLRLREYRREYEGLSLEDGKDPEVL